jgi:predicted membrane channel-forming protein YqfA (hemolysin III family)
MTNAAAAALLISSIMPFLVTVVKRCNWPKWANILVTIATCAIAGTLTFWATGGFSNFNVANLLIIIAGIFVASQATYAAYWKGTDSEAKLNTLTK